MADNLSKSDRKRTMQAVKSKNTAPERSIRASLVGCRVSGWTTKAYDILGKPDFVFRDKKVAVFIDGCFWHGCPVCSKPLPQTNRAYWQNKIDKNIARDQKFTNELQDSGWVVLRIWGHEMKTIEGIRLSRKRIVDTLSESTN